MKPARNNCGQSGILTENRLHGNGMTFLFFHHSRDLLRAESLIRIAEKYNIECINAIPEEDLQFFNAFSDESFSDVSAAVFLFQESKADYVLGFAAGYACAMDVPILLMGKQPEFPGRNTSDFAFFLENDEAFGLFLEQQLAEYLKKGGRRRARSKLLEKGIPVSEEALANAVIGGSEEVLLLFLNAGFSPDIRDKFGVPLLSLAARSGNSQVVKRLLEARAEIDSQAGDRQTTALIDAVSGKHWGIIEDLLSAGADVNIRSVDGQSAIIIAVGLNDEKTVELLLKAGAEVDEPDNLGASARKYANLFNNPGMTALFEKYAAPEKEGV